MITQAEWEAALALARRRREWSHRNSWNRIVHWLHARRHPQQHAERCSLCR